jgi:hypothetical protein
MNSKLSLICNVPPPGTKLKSNGKSLNFNEG